MSTERAAALKRRGNVEIKLSYAWRSKAGTRFMIFQLGKFDGWSKATVSS